MTLDTAKRIAEDEAERLGKAFVVWRLPLWPTDEYGIMLLERSLPPNALVPATIHPSRREGFLF